MVHLQLMVSFSMLFLSLFVILFSTITFLESGLVVYVDAVGPKYISSTHQQNHQTQQQQQQSTRSSQRSKQQKQRPTHPWMKHHSVVSKALQQPTTRNFMDQCVSFLDVLEVIAIRGGGRNDPTTSSDDWSNVNNNQYNSDQNHPYDDSTIDDDDNDYYYGKPSLPQRQSTRKDGGIGSSFGSSLPNMLQKVDRKTGLMLLVSGISVTFLGITLFFNKTIIRLGHLLCIAGVLLSMGLSQTIQYFVQPEKLRATICLGIGVFLVFIGSPLFGIALEVFGILNLFGNMFPIVMIMIKQMPIIGTMLKQSSNTNNNNNNSNRSRRNNNDDDYYYSNDSRRQSQQPPSSRNQYDYDNRDEYAREEDNGLGRRY